MVNADREEKSVVTDAQEVSLGCTCIVGTSSKVEVVGCAALPVAQPFAQCSAHLLTQ